MGMKTHASIGSHVRCGWCCSTQRSASCAAVRFASIDQDSHAGKKDERDEGEEAAEEEEEEEDEDEVSTGSSRSSRKKRKESRWAQCGRSRAGRIHGGSPKRQTSGSCTRTRKWNSWPVGAKRSAPAVAGWVVGSESRASGSATARAASTRRRTVATSPTGTPTLRKRFRVRTKAVHSRVQPFDAPSVSMQTRSRCGVASVATASSTTGSPFQCVVTISADGAAMGDTIRRVGVGSRSRGAAGAGPRPSEVTRPASTSIADTTTKSTTAAWVVVRRSQRCAHRDTAIVRLRLDSRLDGQPAAA